MYIWRFKVFSHIQVFVESGFVISKIYCVLYPKFTVIQAIPVFVAFHKCVVLKNWRIMLRLYLSSKTISHMFKLTL